MSKRLSGSSSLNINHAPQKKKKENELGLIEKIAKSEMKTFRLSRHAIIAIEELAKRFSQEAKIKISMAKIIELAIFSAENKSLDELLQVDK